MDLATKQTLDGAIGISALTWPLWVQYLQASSAVATFLGGLVLLGLRIAIAWKEWRAK